MLRLNTLRDRRLERLQVYLDNDHPFKSIILTVYDARSAFRRPQVRPPATAKAAAATMQIKSAGYEFFNDTCISRSTVTLLAATCDCLWARFLYGAYLLRASCFGALTTPKSLSVSARMSSLDGRQVAQVALLVGVRMYGG